MPEFNNITYPDDYSGVYRNAKLRPMLTSQIKSEGTPEFLHFMQEKSNFRPEMLYETYFRPGAKFRMDAFIKICNAAVTLANNDKWQMRDGWDRIFTKTRQQVLLNINAVTIPAMYETDAFKTYHRKNLEKNINMPPAMMKRLGVSDQKGVQKMLAALQTDNIKDAEKIADGVIRKERIKQKPRELLAAMRKLFR